MVLGAVAAEGDRNADEGPRKTVPYEVEEGIGGEARGRCFGETLERRG